MLELLLLVGIVYWIGSDLGDKAGVIAIAVLILFLLVMFIGACRDGDKAFNNFVDYWKDGGPQKK